jgi:flagellar capping protein FliD
MTMRISGIASGMDIDQMVKDLMKAQSVPLDKMSQTKQYTEWQRDDYRSMNKLLLDFDTSIFDGVGKQATFIQKTVSVSDQNAVSIKNINSTSDFSGTLVVKNLATNATMISSGAIAVNNGSDKLSTVSSEEIITINAIDKDGNMPSTPFKVKFDPSEETMDSLIAKINAGSNVNMFFDSNTKKIAMTAKNSGDIGDNTVPEIALTGSFFTTNLNMDSDNVAAETAKRGSLGINASFTYNGLTTTRTTNTFQLNGFEVNLKKADPTQTLTFNSSPDVDKILDSIVKFVAQYNDTISKINDKIGESKNRDYPPLTDAQRETLSDKEIEKWEEIAHKGTLKNDSALASGLNQMRTDLYSSVGSLSTNQLAKIGIKTSSNYLEKGKLVIDETKLKEAIAKDPNAIYTLFNQDGTTSSEKGIAKRLRETIKSTMSAIEVKAGKPSSVNNSFTLGRSLNDLSSQMDRFKAKLTSIENRYYSQFTAMEKAIQKANQQSAYLTNNMGGGQ